MPDITNNRNQTLCENNEEGRLIQISGNVQQIFESSVNTLRRNEELRGHNNNPNEVSNQIITETIEQLDGRNVIRQELPNPYLYPVGQRSDDLHSIAQTLEDGLYQLTANTTALQTGISEVRTDMDEYFKILERNRVRDEESPEPTDEEVVTKIEENFENLKDVNYYGKICKGLKDLGLGCGLILAFVIIEQLWNMGSNKVSYLPDEMSPSNSTILSIL